MSTNRSVTASFTAWGVASAWFAGSSWVSGTYTPSGSFSIVPYPGFGGTVVPLVCDWNSDGRNDLLTGVGAGGGPHLKIYTVPGGGGLTEVVSSFVAQCDASYCYTGGAWPIACLGNRWVRIQYGNGVVQDHYR